MMQQQAGHEPEHSPPTRPVPAELGEYRLLEKLGEGGMGAVYRAVHLRLDKVVAVKLLLRADQVDAGVIDRFEREMKAVGRLNHPNLIQAYDAREIDGTRFLVTEYVEGVNLQELLRRGGWLPIADACELCRQAALGLQAIHEHGLVHRDIKPSNLMLTCQGLVKVLDLGLARARPAAAIGGTLTVAGQLMGTPDYMAPEQASDCHTIDIRADIYSLGCTLYELLSGEVVFGGPQFKSFFDKIAAHMMRPPRPVQELRSEVSGPLANVVHRMLAKEPGQRYATPAEVVEALTPFAAGCDLQEWLCRCGISETISAAVAPTPAASGVSLPSQTASGRGELAAQILAAADNVARSPAAPPTARQRSWRRGVMLALAGVALVGAGVWGMISRNRPPVEKPSSPTPAAEKIPASGPLPLTPVPRPQGERGAGAGGNPATTTPAATPQPPKKVVQPTPPKPPPASAEPTRAVAPFDAAEAKRYQQAWAAYLRVPVEQTNSVGMRLVLIPPGEFRMGSAEEQGSANAASDERPTHRVRITRPFWLGASEVTQAAFLRVMGSNPSRFRLETHDDGVTLQPEADRRPVESVSWLLALEFCRRLSALPGEQAAGRCYRLPREAEWEYACRAGTATPWSCGAETVLAAHAWFGHPDGKPAPVGQQKPNPWGLYDMHGNVFEWCADWFAPDYYRQSPADDPTGPASGLERVIRGGSWWNKSAQYCRSAARVGATLEGSEMIGFRVLGELHSVPVATDRPAPK